MKLLSTFVVFSQVLILILAQKPKLGENCTKNSGESGKCVKPSECFNSTYLTTTGIDLCDYDEDDNYVVCCGAQPKFKKSIDKCIEYSKIYPLCDPATGLIVGGKNAEVGEFPHAAALGTNKPNEPFKLKCGGSLISDKFILTAAHCNSGEKNIIIARLGFTNIKSTSRDDQGSDYTVKNIISHSKYDSVSTHNDIALVELTEIVTFSRKLRPACLYFHDYKPKEINAVAIGWGLTEYGGFPSDILQKVTLKVLTNYTICENQIKRRARSSIKLFKEQICANGGSGFDTCLGDSGSPLEVTRNENKCLHYIMGLTSYGILCGYGLPSVYTRVYSYIEWIENIVWP